MFDVLPAKMIYGLHPIFYLHLHLHPKPYLHLHVSPFLLNFFRGLRF